MPHGLYAQEKACKQEERLLTRLLEVMPQQGPETTPDSNMVYMLRHQANLLLEMGPSSGLGQSVHPESVPMATFAKFLFTTLLPIDPGLAYKVGLRALRLPILEDCCGEDGEAIAERRRLLHHRQDGHHHHPHHHLNRNNFMLSRIPRWYTLGHIEGQQCALASTMLSSAKGFYQFYNQSFLILNW